jgi:hypothetical protein
MTAKKNYGTSASGVPITEEYLKQAAAEAEAGYDVERLKRRGPGRAPVGSAADEAVPVRLDHKMREALLERAAADATTASDVHPTSTTRVPARRIDQRSHFVRWR